MGNKLVKMEAQEIYQEKASFNKWLLELNQDEKELIIEMMNEIKQSTIDEFARRMNIIESEPEGQVRQTMVSILFKDI